MTPGPFAHGSGSAFFHSRQPPFARHRPVRWICATLSTVAILTLAASFLSSGDPLYQALGILLVVYLVSIHEGSDHMIGQIEELLIAQRELDLGSRQDSLTGLLNRRGIDRILAEACRNGEPLTVLMLDLDGFNQVNDKLGDAAGDDLMRPEVVTGRVGGDEFTIVIRGEVGMGFADPVAAGSVAAVSAPFEVMGQQARIATSVGIAALDGHVASADPLASALLHQAGAALYEAKRAGRGHFRQASVLC